MTLPAITPLPPAPARSDAPNDFSAKADAFAAALPGLVADINEAAGFIDQRAADAQQSAQAALNAVAVAGSAGGIPALAGNAGKVLRINAQENAVFWDTAAPPASAGTPGLVALATPEEANAGTDPAKAIVSAVLAAVLAGYARLDSPTFSGAPKVPTPAAGDDSLRAANTAFVQASLRAAIAALVNQSPAALDTLNELATALGNDPNFATTVLNALAGKQPLSGNLSALAGLAGAANQLGYFTAAGAMALTAFTAFARTLAGAADALAARTTLGACGIAGPVSQTLSGTAVDFTAIPSWAKRLRVGLNGASLNAATAIMAQLGTSAGVATSGYGGTVFAVDNGGAGVGALSVGIDLDWLNNLSAAWTYSGVLDFEHMGGNVWAFKSTMSPTNGTRQASTSGAVALPGGLTTLRLTSHNGTASFDAGTASLTYEG